MSGHVESARKLWDRDAADLMRCLLRLRSVSRAKRFIRDLMTEDEIRMIVDRWRVARSLAAGRTYRQIEQETGLSSRTIARISRWLREG
jgi:TrpR-related protein YerC/YecD